MLKMYDIAVIGRGPAGLTAAVNAAAEGLSVVAVGVLGGQAGLSSRIENYPGYPDGIDGLTLATRFDAQAKRLGADSFEDWATGLYPDGAAWVVELAANPAVRAHCVILATGLVPRRIDGVDGLYGARVQDYEVAGQEVSVVGGANSAGQAALWLASHARLVSIFSRSPLEKSMSAYLLDRIRSAKNVRVYVGSMPDKADCIFIYAGFAPSVRWADCECDTQGFLVTRSLHTNKRSVYAVGDIRHDAVRRVATAVGDGARVIAAILKEEDW